MLIQVSGHKKSNN